MSKLENCRSPAVHILSNAYSTKARLGRSKLLRESLQYQESNYVEVLGTLYTVQFLFAYKNAMKRLTRNFCLYLRYLRRCF
jgi:hypothetical protein